MRKKSLSGRIKDLAFEKKIMALASLATLVSCFLPWYGINSRVINEWWNAYSNIGSVAGYVITVFSLLSLGLLLAPVLRPELDLDKKLPWKSTSLLILLNVQSLFVALLFVPIYAQFSLINASNSGARFGIYVAIISSLVAAVVAVVYQRKMERLSVREQEFVSMPRAHRAVNDWEEPQDQSSSTVETVEEGQETMFESYQDQEQEQVEASQSSPDYDKVGEDQSRYHRQ
jgi:hypothetical protein